MASCVGVAGYTGVVFPFMKRKAIAAAWKLYWMERLDKEEISAERSGGSLCPLSMLSTSCVNSEELGSERPQRGAGAVLPSGSWLLLLLPKRKEHGAAVDHGCA